MSLRFTLTYLSLKSWADRLSVPYRFNDEVAQVAVLTRVMDTDVPLVYPAAGPRHGDDEGDAAVHRPEQALPGNRRVADDLQRAILHGGVDSIRTRARSVSRITLPAKELEYSDDTLRFFALLVVSSAEAMAKLLYAVAHKGQVRRSSRTPRPEQSVASPHRRRLL